jgi:hypothetical protein
MAATTSDHKPARVNIRVRRQFRQLRPDPYVERARPAFLYVMYALLLWSLPMSWIAAWRPHVAAAMTRGMAAYLAAIPEPLYALFGTGYLGYTVARSWAKAKGVER